MKLEKLYDKAYDRILHIGPKLVVELIVLLIGLRLIKVLQTHIRLQMSTNNLHSSLQPFFLSLAITLLYVLLIIFVMSIVGFELTTFTTVIGSFSVGAGLALSEPEIDDFRYIVNVWVDPPNLLAEKFALQEKIITTLGAPGISCRGPNYLPY